MTEIDYLSALPEDLFLHLIFPCVDIESLMQLKPLSKLFNYLISRYQEICTTSIQIKPRYIDKVSTLFPKLCVEVVIDRNTKFGVADFSCLKVLSFYNSAVLVDLSKLTSLESLNLISVKCKLYRGEFDNISALTNLENLKIGNTYGVPNMEESATRAIASAIPTFTKLHVLAISNVHVDFDITALRELTYLELSYCTNTSDISKASTNLTHLHIISDNPPINIDNLSNLSKLEYLYISNTDYSDIIIDPSNLTSLVKLHIYNYKTIRDIDLPNLCEFEYIRGSFVELYISSSAKLTKLHLSGISNPISFARFPDLKELVIANIHNIHLIKSFPVGLEILELSFVGRHSRDLNLIKLTKLKDLIVYNYPALIVLPKQYIKKRYIRNCSSILYTHKVIEW